jgi:hypothetical protein
MKNVIYIYFILCNSTSNQILHSVFSVCLQPYYCGKYKGKDNAYWPTQKRIGGTAL